MYEIWEFSFFAIDRRLDSASRGFSTRRGTEIAAASEDPFRSPHHHRQPGAPAIAAEHTCFAVAVGGAGAGAGAGGDIGRCVFASQQRCGFRSFWHR